MSYHHHDHSHCWEEENPPYGQKIKHFECCLCQKLHPEIKEKYSGGYRDGYEQGKFDGTIEENTRCLHAINNPKE